MLGIPFNGQAEAVDIQDLVQGDWVEVRSCLRGDFASVPGDLPAQEVDFVISQVVAIHNNSDTGLWRVWLSNGRVYQAPADTSVARAVPSGVWNY
jgi:hypothetical protein